MDQSCSISEKVGADLKRPSVSGLPTIDVVSVSFLPSLSLSSSSYRSENGDCKEGGSWEGVREGGQWELPFMTSALVGGGGSQKSIESKGGCVTFII